MVKHRILEYNINLPYFSMSLTVWTKLNSPHEHKLDWKWWIHKSLQRKLLETKNVAKQRDSSETSNVKHINLNDVINVGHSTSVTTAPITIAYRWLLAWLEKQSRGKGRGGEAWRWVTTLPAARVPPHGQTTALIPWSRALVYCTNTLG